MAAPPWLAAALTLWRRPLARLDPGPTHYGLGLACSVAVALCLVGGLLTGHSTAGAIACGGAFTVGTGIYQSFSHSHRGPMLVTTIGIGLSTAIGTLAGLSPWALAPLLLAYGFGTGLLTAIGPAAQWIGQQCAIFLVVAADFPGESLHALDRALLVVAGGLLQMACLEALPRFGALRQDWRAWPRARVDMRHAARSLRAALRWDDPSFQFALRVAVALLAAGFVARAARLHNGYWIAMTMLILLRQDFRTTWQRGLIRVAGTAAGVLLASLLEAWLLPGPPGMLAMALVFAVLSVAFQQVLYGVFVIWLSAYIVSLLVFGGLLASVVVENRLIGTALGMAIAMAAHLHFRWHMSRRSS